MPREATRPRGSPYDQCMHLLVVEDEDTIAEPLVEGLVAEGFEVTRVATGRRPSMRPRSTSSCSTFDSRMSTVSRSAARCVSLRRSDHHAHGEGRGDRPGGWPRASRRRLRRQAVRPPRLIARIRAVARRTPGRHEARETLVVGALEVDVPARRATIDGRELQLTLKEFDLLVLRVRAGRRRRPPEDLARGVGYDVVRLLEDSGRPRRGAAQEARRPDADRDGARDRAAAARTTAVC